MSAEEKKKLMLVDGHSILNRAFYGMPDLTNSKGVHTGAVYGFLNILFSQLDEEKPDYLVVAFDVHAPTFRHEAYAEYKGTRSAMPDELRQQVPLIKKMLTAMQIEICEQAGLEADDILGTLARKAEAMDMDVVLISGDRDLLQIATDRICIRIPRTRQGQTSIDDFRAPQVLESYGVTPLQFIDVKALMGDSSDNIPGVPKVGEKTATQLIKDYGSVDGVYQHLEEIKKPALHRNLAENEDKARLSLFLVTIKTDCDVELDPEKAATGDYYTREAFELCTELGFKNFLPRFDRDVLEEKEETFSIVKITGADGLADLEKTLLDRISVESRFTVGIWPVLDRAGYGMEKPSLLAGAAVSYNQKRLKPQLLHHRAEQGTEFDRRSMEPDPEQSIDGSASRIKRLRRPEEVRRGSRQQYRIRRFRGRKVCLWSDGGGSDRLFEKNKDSGQAKCLCRRGERGGMPRCLCPERSDGSLGCRLTRGIFGRRAHGGDYGPSGVLLSGQPAEK